MAKKVSEEISGRDELASMLADNINKKFKDFKAVHFLDGREETPTDLTEWISTGSTLLDLAVSNRPYGGFPVGRIVELQGMEASGKSLIMAHVLANTQKKGGLAVYIDTENALSEEFLRATSLLASIPEFQRVLLCSQTGHLSFKVVRQLSINQPPGP